MKAKEGLYMYRLMFRPPEVFFERIVYGPGRSVMDAIKRARLKPGSEVMSVIRLGKVGWR